MVEIRFIVVMGFYDVMSLRNINIVSILVLHRYQLYYHRRSEAYCRFCPILCIQILAT